MIDTNKVLIGLGQHISGRAPERCGSCPYFNGDSGYGVTCRDELLDDLYEMLESQEPRVLSWREVIVSALECKSVYIEVKESEDKELGDDRWATITQFRDNKTNGMIRTMSSYVTSEILFQEFYGKTWRCWNTKPSKEDMEAEPWDD